MMNEPEVLRLKKIKEHKPIPFENVESVVFSRTSTGEWSYTVHEGKCKYKKAHLHDFYEQFLVFLSFERATKHPAFRLDDPDMGMMVRHLASTIRGIDDATGYILSVAYKPRKKVKQ